MSDQGPATSVPAVRVTRINTAPVNPDGDYVLYWMTASRRPGWNYSLDRAVEWCRDLDRPLIVLEALRVGYRWASDRNHRFVIDGMQDNRDVLASKPVLYYPYVELEPGAGKGLLEKLATRACAVVTDDFPCFFLPRMVASAAARLPVRLEMVDSNGIYPVRQTDRLFLRAVDFRRHLHTDLLPHLTQRPLADPLVDLPRPCPLPGDITQRWPTLDRVDLSGLPIDHRVAPAAAGGNRRALEVLSGFLEGALAGYDQKRRALHEQVSSGLSPYLHFGQLSVHQVFAELLRREQWTPAQLGSAPRGRRLGWWGMSSAAEVFLDQLITWRELGFNTCCLQPHDYYRYDSLPEWARRTLAAHEGDRREYCYDLDQFEQALTHEPLWNAAQNQLRWQGTLHNTVRMLWGKKILHWSRSPRLALEIMLELNNKYALDGRDPNSYSGIFWVLGRYDRPWGPERPVFGTVRCMTCQSARRKFAVQEYVRRWTDGGLP